MCDMPADGVGSDVETTSTSSRSSLACLLAVGPTSCTSARASKVTAHLHTQRSVLNQMHWITCCKGKHTQHPDALDKQQRVWPALTCWASVSAGGCVRFLMMTGFALLGLEAAGGLLGPIGFAAALGGSGPGSASEGLCRASAAALTACRKGLQTLMFNEGPTCKMSYGRNARHLDRQAQGSD